MKHSSASHPLSIRQGAAGCRTSQDGTYGTMGSWGTWGRGGAGEFRLFHHSRPDGIEVGLICGLAPFPNRPHRMAGCSLPRPPKRGP